MKSTQQIIHHPNQENKTGEVPFASPVQRNFSNTESLPGKDAHMRESRHKNKTSVMTRLFRKLRDAISSIDLTSM